MENIIVAIILLIIIGSAIAYVVKAKKSGAKCIGCPAGGACASKNKAGCGCGCGGAENTVESKSDCGCGCNTDTEA